jgi:general L-amino acid transport system permease protein
LIVAGMAQASERSQSRQSGGRVSPWNDVRVRSAAFQLAVIALVIALLAYLASNAVDNLRRHDIATGFGFLGREASFAIGTTLIPYSPADTYARALLVGLLNTLLVAGLGIVLATLLGLVIGLARLSGNWLIGRLALGYVELMRNTPLLLQLFVWWDILRISAPSPRQAWQPLPDVFISNRGLVLPVPTYQPLYPWLLLAGAGGLSAAWLFARWARARQARTGRPLPAGWIGAALVLAPPLVLFLAGGAPFALDAPHLAGFNFQGGQSVTPEFAALLFGLVAYTAAFIAEIVRSGILAVSRGQTEAALALGLTRGQVMRLVVLPQAVRVIVPPLTSEYLNLIKNSSLAVAIGFPDFVSIGNTTINQTGQAIEGFILIAAVYELINLLTALAMNLYNRRVALVER